MTKRNGAMYRAWVTEELRLLSYVQHMAETTHSDAAKLMFRQYVELEKQRLIATGTLGISAH
jgi:hypothetical protein